MAASVESCLWDGALCTVPIGRFIDLGCLTQAEEVVEVERHSDAWIRAEVIRALEVWRV